MKKIPVGRGKLKTKFPQNRIARCKAPPKVDTNRVQPSRRSPIQRSAIDCNVLQENIPGLASFLETLPIQLPMHKIQAFCQKHHIVYLALFGSLLTDKFTKKSDVDFLVRFDENHGPTLFTLVNMEFELRKIIKRRVDLKTPEDLSRYFRDKVVANAKMIYGR